MSISVKSSTMVKPIAETPRGSLWLSNLDLLMPANYHTHLVYFYRFNGAANFFDPTVLKAALSQTLVEFYPCAGRLKRGDNNRIEITCSGEGVLFVEAEADGEMDQLGEFAPVAELRLTPEVDYSKGISTFPLLLLQITRFKCGGVCFGYVIEHHLADGPSAFHFLRTWTGIARGTRTTIRPFFDRRVLSSRSPPQPKFSHIEYHPPPPLKTPLDTSETTFSMFKLTPVHVNALKAQCKKDDDDQGISYSTYEVVAGHIWQCVCKARGLAQDQETKLYIVVAGRPRLQPPLPQGYFGNAIFSATPIATCGELESRPLDFAVGKIREAVARADDEYMRSAIDYLEVQGDVSALARGSYTNKCPNLAIVSWIGLPVYDDVDFGWGKHVYMGPGYAPYEGKSYLLPSPENDGTLLYAVTLLKQHMKVFEKLLYQGTRHAKL